MFLGVQFKSPHDGSMMMLTPEKSIEIQNNIGADIIMQLDDVVHSSTTGKEPYQRTRDVLIIEIESDSIFALFHN